MNTAEAADLFQRWAGTEGFLADNLGVGPDVSKAEAALVKPITPAGKGILRTKQIQAVIFNEAAGKVTVLLRRPVPALKNVKLLPSFVDTIPIEYRQGVPNLVGDGVTMPTSGPIYQIRHIAGVDHYTCGSSISVGNCRDAGTLGCLVRNEAGKLFGLSNNHVSGSCSFAEVGLPILAPGVHDVAAKSLPPFTIGFHEQALPLVAGAPANIDHSKNLDAAVFEIRDENLVSSYQGNSYDTPFKTAPLQPEMIVEKVGRTTGLTAGTVLGQLNGAVFIPYNAPLFDFSGRVYFDGLFAISGKSDLFSDHGDSGSLVTCVDGEGQRVAVGIVVGGMTDSRAPGGKLSLVLPIERILAELKVKLVAGHNI